VPGCLALVRKQLRETVPTVDHGLAAGLLRLVDALLEGAGYRPNQRQPGGWRCGRLLGAGACTCSPMHGL
jgi:hypothetical protein